jgi:hypothetical protein
VTLVHFTPCRPTAALAFPLLFALAGCGGGDGGGTAPDTEDPAVAITAPATGTAVSGDVTVTATASDNQSVIRTIQADGSFETTVTTGLEVEFEEGLEGEQSRSTST